MTERLAILVFTLFAVAAQAATNTVTPAGLFVNLPAHYGPVSAVPNKWGNAQGLGGDWVLATRLGWRKLEPAAAVATNLTVVGRAYAQDPARGEWALEVLTTRPDTELAAERRAALVNAARGAASNDVARAALEVLIERSAALEARLAAVDAGTKSTASQIKKAIDARAQTNAAERAVSIGVAAER